MIDQFNPKIYANSYYIFIEQRKINIKIFKIDAMLQCDVT